MRITTLFAAFALFAATAPSPALAALEAQEQDSTDQAAPDAEQGNDGIPWQAEIFSNFTGWTSEELENREAWDLAHKCGGSLIADGWILTAAHCISEKRIENGFRVRLGAAFLNNGEGVTYRIDRMIQYPKYNNATKLHDIALIHYVADEMTDANAVTLEIRPVPLYDGAPLGPGLPVTAAGWGQLESGKNKGYQAELTVVDLKTVDCSKYSNLQPRIHPSSLCAWAPGQDTCRGDSGGPLWVGDVENAVLVGVVSWGDGCYRDDSAGVYMRIDQKHYGNWIARAMAGDPSVNDEDD